MIQRDGCIELLLREFPAFAPHWRAYEREWEEMGSPGLCTEMSAFADFVKEQILTVSPPEIARLFAVIEHLLVFGDDAVQTAATTCCLENILNVTPSKVPAELYVQYLGPKSRDFCRAWDEFTGVKTPGL